MENAADALHMAASVMIFVLALTIAINSFGQVRQVSQSIIDYNDREYDYSYVEENKDSSGNVLTERIVSLESIVPSIYKAYRENYRIVFDNLAQYNDDKGLFRRRNDDGEYEEVYQIDLEKETIGTDEQKEQFLMAILYGNDIDNFSEIKENLRRNSGIILYDDGIYDIIRKNNWNFKESIGVYYQEQASGEDATTTPGVTTSGDDVPEANLTEKRVITYTIL